MIKRCTPLLTLAEIFLSSKVVRMGFKKTQKNFEKNLLGWYWIFIWALVPPPLNKDGFEENTKKNVLRTRIMFLNRSV